MRLDLFWRHKSMLDEEGLNVGFGMFSVGHFIWLFLMAAGIAAFALFTCGVMSANGATCARRWRFSSSCSRYSSSASWH